MAALIEHAGTIDFADRQVNPSTGAIRSRACSRTPEIYCGRAVTERFAQAISTQKDALLVPQRAVTELQGSYQVAVVDAQNKVSIRSVTLGERGGVRLDYRQRPEAGEQSRRGRRSEGASRHASEPEAVLRPKARRRGG